MGWVIGWLCVNYCGFPVNSVDVCGLVLCFVVYCVWFELLGMLFSGVCLMCLLFGV